MLINYSRWCLEKRKGAVSVIGLQYAFNVVMISKNKRIIMHISVGTNKITV